MYEVCVASASNPKAGPDSHPSAPGPQPRPGSRRTGTLLRLLLVEDSEDDALLLERALTREGFSVQLTRVETRSAMRDALLTGEWSCVVSDFQLPTFDGLSALELLQDSGLDLPFILVSGAIDQETALAAMRDGAHDFVMKDDLGRLGPAIRRELAQAEGRRARQRAEQSFRHLVDNSLQGLIIWTADGVVYANPSITTTFGLATGDLAVRPSRRLTEMIHPEDRELADTRLADLLAGRPAPPRLELRIVRTDGKTRWLEMYLSRIDYGGAPAAQAAVMDITERKLHEREQQAIVALAAALRAAKRRNEMAPIILDETLALLEADGAALVMRDQSGGGGRFELARGVWQKLLHGTLAEGEGLSGLVFATGEAYRSDDAGADPRLARPDILGTVRALAGAPLIADDQVIGVLWVGRGTPIEVEDMRVLTAIAEMSASAVHRVTLHEETQLRVHRLNALRAIDLAITTTRSLDLVFDVVLDQVVSQLGVDAASILVYDSGHSLLVSGADRGLADLHIPTARIPLGEGLAGRVGQQERLVEVSNLSEAERSSPRDIILAKSGFRSYFAVPLLAKGELRGVLEVLNREPLPADGEYLGFLQAVAWQAATAIDSATLVTELRASNVELVDAYETTLEGWARALELRDQETEGHTRRVTELTERVGAALGLDQEQLVHARRGALLHDIGKMAIPDRILLKPGPLDDDEWIVMRKHPDHAIEMLKPISHLAPALAIPQYHHEKWDGSGYPFGLAGEEIPLEARIFAVIDVWDALTSDRPYRNAWPAAKVRSYLEENAGAHFDPRVVETFLEVIDTDGA